MCLEALRLLRMTRPNPARPLPNNINEPGSGTLVVDEKDTFTPLPPWLVKEKNPGELA